MFLRLSALLVKGRKRIPHKKRNHKNLGHSEVYKSIPAGFCLLIDLWSLNRNLSWVVCCEMLTHYLLYCLLSPYSKVRACLRTRRASTPATPRTCRPSSE